MRRTPLYPFVLEHGGQMVDFAGWEMPIQYKWRDEAGGGGGIHAEHKQVRASGGFFDVSHMGRLRLQGRHARRLMERLCTRRVSDMAPGRCRYSLVCNERGGVKDDILVYRIDDDDFLVVCNAANRDKLVKHIEDIRGDLVAECVDRTEATAMVAIQGPRVMDVVSNFSKEIPALKPYRFAEKNYLIMKLIVSRTGYTGEDGVEVILPAGVVSMAMKLLMKDLGKDENALVKPAGLGCRDTLRLEAGMALYGHELDEDTNALSTGLGFAINLDKDGDERGEPFVGLQALRDLTEPERGGPHKALVGLFTDGKRTARQHMRVLDSGERHVGDVTSGCQSPTLGRGIAMAYVDRDLAEPGSALRIATGKDTVIDAEVTPLPFYKRPKAKA